MKTIVITGAAGVLCSCFARALTNENTAIALLDLNGQAAQAVAAQINENGGNARGYTANVLDRDELERVHQQVLADFGKCDILINGAGGNSPKCTTADEFYKPKTDEKEDVLNFFNLNKDGFSFVFDLNILGTLIPTQVFAADMLENGGCILNVSSMNAFRPLTKIPAYSAAKAGVSNLTQWLAVHFAKSNIRVNAIAPGFFVTNQNKALLFDKQDKPTPRTEKILAATPMGRFGEPQELIGTLKWLTDNTLSGFVTGVIVPVDGGFSAYSGV